MTHLTHILAEGVPVGALFAAAIAIVIAIANAVAKQKQADTTQEKMRSQRHSRDGRSQQRENRQREADARDLRVPMDRDQTLAEVLREQMRRGQSSPGKMPTAPTANRKKAKQRQVAKPPPMPAVRPVALAAAPVDAAPAVAVASRSGLKSETARNVRMLLQPAGIREAFILSEVLGKPKSLRDD